MIRNYINDAPSGVARWREKSRSPEGDTPGRRSFMVILEKNKLDEMAILVASSSLDNLPFRIAVKSPDHSPPHAHIMDKETGKTELGQFLLSVKIPSKPSDIKDYKKGITSEMRLAIFKWAKLPHKVLTKYKNWEALNFLYSLNNPQ
jgi:hypothetical protein